MPRNALGIVLAFVGAFTIAAIFVLAFVATGRAQTPPGKLGTWADEPLELRQWLGRQLIPHSASSSCCGEADAIEVEIIGGDDLDVWLKITNGRGYLENGRVLKAMRSRILDGRNGDPNVWGRTIAWARQDGWVWCVAPAPQM